MPDPLNDPSFAARLSKLLPMLGSGQAGEADAARRKLIEHLGSQGLTLTDLAQRLQRQAAVAAPPAASGSRDAERQVVALKAVLNEANEELARARAVERELQAAVNRLSVLANTLKRARNRALAIAGVSVAVGGGAALVVAIKLLAPAWQDGRNVGGTPGIPLVTETGEQAAMHSLLPPGPGEQRGRAAVADLPIRYEPRDDAAVRAYLPRDSAVVIVREVRIGQRTWLFLRSPSGWGWARSGDVLR